MSACMHRLRSIKVKLSSHLFGVIGQSLFGVFPSLHARDSSPTSWFSILCGNIAACTKLRLFPHTREVTNSNKACCEQGTRNRSGRL